MGMMRKTGGRERGEIVQVEGGLIVRATGKKDRHSKVYTSKGPRDRRVRLAAHTAIQFYDVQDRLGYDRPSKAVDWLIKKAKLAIDKLDQLPPFFPTTNLVVDHHDDSTDFNISRLEHHHHHHEQQQHQQSDEFNETVPHYIPTSLESFFPTNNPSNLSLNFESYPHSGANKPQDLCLSLQSYQDHHNRNSVGHHHDNVHATEQSLFGGGCWDDDNNNQNEINRFSRMMGWSNTNNGNSHNGGGDQEENRNGFLFNHHQMIGSDFSQRGTLQSSFIAPLRAAWDDNEMPEMDHRNSIAGDRYVPEGFSGFCIPSRFHDNEEHDDPSSVSPSSLQ